MRQPRPSDTAPAGPAAPMTDQPVPGSQGRNSPGRMPDRARLRQFLAGATGRVGTPPIAPAFRPGPEHQAPTRALLRALAPHGTVLPARANRSIFFAAGRFVGRGRHRKPLSLSVAQVHEKFEAMMSTRGDRYRDVTSVAGVIAYVDAENP